MSDVFSLKDFTDFLMESITENLSSTSDKQINQMAERLIFTEARGGKIIIIGAGRTGLVAKAFAMRLYHLGFDVSVVGETIVPRAEHKDLLLAFSGSGNTRFPVDAAKSAKDAKTEVIAVTSNPKSKITKVADLTVIVKGKTKEDSVKEQNYTKRQLTGLHETLSPLGSMFELTLMVFLEGMIALLMNKLSISEEDIRIRHTNI